VDLITQITEIRSLTILYPVL